MDHLPKRSDDHAKKQRPPSIYNIRAAPLFPVVSRDIFQTDHPNVTIRVKRGAPQSAQSWAPSYCGGDFTELSGILRSPGYPLYYPNNKVASVFFPQIF